MVENACIELRVINLLGYPTGNFLFFNLPLETIIYVLQSTPWLQGTQKLLRHLQITGTKQGIRVIRFFKILNQFETSSPSWNVVEELHNLKSRCLSRLVLESIANDCIDPLCSFIKKGDHHQLNEVSIKRSIDDPLLSFIFDTIRNTSYLYYFTNQKLLSKIRKILELLFRTCCKAIFRAWHSILTQLYMSLECYNMQAKLMINQCQSNLQCRVCILHIIWVLRCFWNQALWNVQMCDSCSANYFIWTETSIDPKCITGAS